MDDPHASGTEVGQPKRRGWAGAPVLAVVSFALVLGVVATAAAVSGSAGGVRGVDAQYPPPVTTEAPSLQGVTTTPRDGDQVSAGVVGVGEGGEGGGDQVSAGVLGAGEGEGEGGGGLPFTGYAILPLLVLGAVLLVSGAVLRRRTRPADPS